MKKWLKISIISVIILGILAVPTYFLSNYIITKNQQAVEASQFRQKLKDSKGFNFNHIYVNFENVEKNHNLKFDFENLDFKYQSRQLEFSGMSTISYDGFDVFKGNIALTKENFYLTTAKSFFGRENVTFGKKYFKNFFQSLINSNFIENETFEEDFFYNFIEKLFDNIERRPTFEAKQKTFEIKLRDYDSSIILYSDNSLNLTRFKTITPLVQNQYLCSFNASQITYKDINTISVPSVYYENCNPFANGLIELFNDFNKTTGKGLDLFVGNIITNEPLTISYNSKDLFSLIGNFTIYNKTKESDYLYEFNGNIKFSYDSINLNEEAKFYLLNNTIYLSYQKYKFSLKIETILEILGIDFDQFSLQIPVDIYDFADLLIYNSYIDQDYVMFERYENTEDYTTVTIALPKLEPEQKNIEIQYNLFYNNEKLFAVSINDVEFNDLKIKHIMLSGDSNTKDRPTLSILEYLPIDEFLKKYIAF